MDWRTEESWFDSWQEQDIFLFSLSVQTSFGIHSAAFCSGGSWGVPWAKMAGEQTDHLIPTAIEVGMCGVIPLLPLCLYGKLADTFTFMLVVLVKILHTVSEVVNLIHNSSVY